MPGSELNMSHILPDPFGVSVKTQGGKVVSAESVAKLHLMKIFMVGLYQLGLWVRRNAVAL
jgi:hypothetical protein